MEKTGSKKTYKTTEAKTTQPSITQRYLDNFLSTDDQCMAFLVAQRWPEGVRCPRCNSEKVHKLSRPWKWQCKQCAKNGYRFSPLVGTIFENTNVGLSVWFKVIFAMCHSKKGISALQIYRMIGGKYPHKKGAYRTAWYMCHRIRCAMQNPEFQKLCGVVEVDETYIGGSDRNRHWNKKSAQKRADDPRGPLDEKIGFDKVGVVGAISRKGNVVARVIGGTDARTLQGFVERVVDEKVELLATDEHPAYKYTGRKHAAVNHSEGEYVRGVVHTNNIESFWSLLKRGVMGSFHHVSKEYLPLYLNEFSFRFNNRKEPDIFQKVLALA
jgi:transposase-like protein/IS1 family transposase